MAHNHPERRQGLLSAVKRELLGSAEDVEAILIVGSTAFNSDSQFKDWDDIDAQVYTRAKPSQDSHYGILTDSKRRILFSAYYSQLNPANCPQRCVLEQKDVRILSGKEEALRHIHVDRPRRVEPLPKEIPRFDAHHETLFNILVDIFFILNRYEAKGKPNATKARVARDGLRTIAKHFYRFYGIDKEIPNGVKWRRLLKDVDSLLTERDYTNLCHDKDFASRALSLMARRDADS
jgi:hypothetical protein